MHFKIKKIKGGKYLYIIKNKRVNGKITQPIQKYVGTADQVYEMITADKSTHIASYPFGKPAALIKAAEEVGLMDSMNLRIDRKELAGLTAAEYLLLIIIGRAEHALSRNVLDGYFGESALQFIWDPAYQISSQNFLNYMSKLDEETIQNIELDVSRTLINLGLKPTRLIFDTTNFYTHIEHGEDLPKKGNSKDKRFEKNLIGVGLATSDHNIPFQSFTYPANKNDSKLFSELIDGICNRLQEIKISCEDVVIVFDRGMNSSENIKKVTDRMHMVGSLPASMCREFFRIPLSKYSESWENASGHNIKAHRISGEWYETNFIGVIRYNEFTRKKQIEVWEREKTKILSKVEDIRSKLNRKGKGRRLTGKGINNRLADAIQKQYRGLFDYQVVIEKGKLQLDFKLNEDREKDYISAMGKTVIFSDMKQATSQQIVEIYDSRNKIETDIAWLKEKLLIPLKPIYVRKDNKIRAHVFLCVMGLLLYNYLLYIIDDPALSLDQLAHQLDLMRLGAVHIGEGKGKRKKVEFVIEDMTKRTAEIFGKLQLGRYIPA